MESSITNYIYLLHEREFIRTSENIYKVGMTCQSNLNRFSNYPKGSILLFQMKCNDCRFVESIVLQVFNYRFYKCSFYGNEYFQGNKKDMIHIIFLIIKYENEIRDCVTDRSKYIDNILKQHTIENNVTLLENTNVATIENTNVATIENTNVATIENNDDQPKQYHCDKCDYYTKRSFNYIKHIKTDKHKSRSENMINICNYNPSELSNVPSYRCPNCDRKYMVKRSLWRHSKNCHSSSKSDAFNKVLFNIFTKTIVEMCKSH